MSISKIQVIAFLLFVIAISHTFVTSFFEKLSHKRKHSHPNLAKFYHLLSEVEVVFGIYGFLLFIAMLLVEDLSFFKVYFNNLKFTEPKFVFAMMLMSGTSPILSVSKNILIKISNLLPFDQRKSFFFVVMTLGPLLGSFITEPAAMTVTALILYETFYQETLTKNFKFGLLALLLVNISIGGTLTSFAAPPVVMVAHAWALDSKMLLLNLGYKAIMAILISNFIFSLMFKSDLKGIFKGHVAKKEVPKGIIFTNLIFLALLVLVSHVDDLIILILILFLGFYMIYKEHFDDLKIKESLMVGFFLSSLIFIGNIQSFWIKEVIHSLNDFGLFVGATLLTGITDNALLTYLGSLSPMTESMKWSLLAGAVTGGGLTVIANAPNLIAVSLFKDKFIPEGVNPVKLLIAALIPTLVTFLCFYFLPSLF